MTYGYQRYNQHDVLKPHWGFWLTSLFLLRHLIGFVLVSMSGRGGRVGVSKEAIDLGDVMSLIEPIYMIADTPALLLLYAVGARVPKAGAAVRGIWNAGRWLILASVGIYLTLFVVTHGTNLETFGPATWTSLLLSALVASFAFGSRYMKDLFSQFPAAETK